MSTFCVLPWMSQEYYLTNSTPCCLLPRDYNLAQIKHDLLHNIKTPACNRCWKNEELGVQSRRIQENIFVDAMLDRDISNIENDIRNNDTHYPVQLFQISLGNLCNSACVTCDTKLSSKWAELKFRASKTLTDSQSPQVITDIDYKQATRISFSGGEPLLHKELGYMLDELASCNNTKCFISIITNGSVQIAGSLLATLKKFTNLNICVSIDGTESVFEYTRWPGKWQVLTENIKQYKELTNSVSVSYTVSSINIWSHTETIKWFAQQHLPYNINLVTHPTWLNLQFLPVALKQSLPRDPFCQSFNKINRREIELDEFYNHIVEQDNMKNISISNFIPDLQMMISNHLR